MDRRKAAIIVLNRRRARLSFVDFCRFVDKEFASWGNNIPAHIETSCQALQELGEGKIRKLMLCAPPRSWKSRLCSQLFSAWYMLSHDPGQVILAAYGASLSAEISRNARGYVEAPAYRQLNNHEPYLRSPWNDGNWAISARRSYYASAIGGAITGHGFNMGGIDDPFKTREEANSLRQRDKIWDWYRGVFSTRAEHGAGRFLVNTRWGVDDLSGRMLSLDPEGWTVLSFPAIVEGKSFWQEKFPIAELEKIQREVGSFEWASQYMQQPYNKDGGFFKRSDFLVATGTEQFVLLVRYWDTASTVYGDFTVGCLVGLTTQNEFCVLDVTRFRNTPQIVDDTVLSTALRDGFGVAVVREVPHGAAGIDLTNHYQHLLYQFRFEGERPYGDKKTRAIIPSAKVEAGLVKLPENASWKESFLDELEAFPAAKHDDQVDAFTGAIRWLITHKQFTINAVMTGEYTSGGCDEYEN